MPCLQLKVKAVGLKQKHEYTNTKNHIHHAPCNKDFQFLVL